MGRAIVSVKRIIDAQVFDLEVPTNLESQKLAIMIAELLGWDCDAEGKKVHYRIEAKPCGKILQPAENLEDVGAVDGSWLIFYDL